MSFFITIEGIEGAGKSTLQQRLAERLRQLGREVVLTYEPGSTSVGQAIRRILLDPNTENLDSKAELLLFAADRAQHLAEVVRPALARGTLVICDRYIHSTVAYQGYGKGLDIAELKKILDYTTTGLSPDLVILLDLDPQAGLHRVSTRASGSNSKEHSHDRMEMLSLAFHERVRQGFLEMADEPDNNFVVVDATKSAEEIAEQVFQNLSKLLKV